MNTEFRFVLTLRDSERQKPSILPIRGPSRLMKTDAGVELQPFADTPPTGRILLHLSPIRHHPPRPWELFVISPPGETMLLNGFPTAHAFIATDTAEISLLVEGLSLHLAIFRAAAIVNATPDMAGQICVSCRGAIAAGSPVYVCNKCGGLLHAEDPAQKKDALDCALLVSECTCSAPINLQEAHYSSWPEGVEP